MEAKMPSTESPEPARTPERRRDLDLLRVLIVFGLVFFHTLRVFDMLPWAEGVKNQPPSAVATLVTGFLSVWGMPLLFVIAGFGIWHSLGKRTPGLFLRERVERLLVPLVFGTLLVVPWQMYFHLKQTDPAFQQTFWQYLPRFFDVTFCRDPLKLFVCADPETELFGTAHLWFLRYLLVLSVALLPLLLFLRSQGGTRAVGRFADFAAGPWVILLLALPLALAEAVFRTTGEGGWNAYAYALFILYGFLFAADRRFWTAMGGAWRSALAIGLAFSLIYVGSAFVIGVFEGIDPGQGDDWGSILSRASQGIAGWAMIVAILGFGARPRRVRTGAEKPVKTDESPRPDLGLA
jgi:peptidoglycan/LPS O-acetylase OafA/YrhL